MRVKTGIRGFDELAQGGFTTNSVNLLSGLAGSGKTLFGVEFLYNGAKDGEASLFIAVEEEKENIERVFELFCRDHKALEKSQKLLIIDLGEMRDVDARDKTISFAELKGFIENFLKKVPVKRVVIDSISAVGLHYATLEQLRSELFSFVRFLRRMNVTSVLITEAVEEQGLTRFGIEQFLSDSFIVLGLEPVSGELRRTITIRKMRFTSHDTTKRPFHITSRGMEIFVKEVVV